MLQHQQEPPISTQNKTHGDDPLNRFARITEGVCELETWTKPHAGWTDKDGEHPLPASHHPCVHWKPTCDEAGHFMMNAVLV
jgi:hypothetical protein